MGRLPDLSSPLALQRQPVTRTRRMTLATLEKRLRTYEARFGVPSSDMRRAFLVDGQVCETEDLRDWSRLYRTYRAAQASLSTRRGTDE